MRIDHAEVERSKVRVRIGKSNKHGVVGSRVTLVDFAGRLVGVSSVVAGNLQRSVGEVELRDPGDESGGTGNGIGDV